MLKSSLLLQSLNMYPRSYLEDIAEINPSIGK